MPEAGCPPAPAWAAGLTRGLKQASGYGVQSSWLQGALCARPRPPLRLLSRARGLGPCGACGRLDSSSEAGRLRLLTDAQPDLLTDCKPACAWPGGPQPSDDAAAMAEAAPARVSAPAHGRRVRGSRPTRPEAPPTLAPALPARVEEPPAWRPRRLPKPSAYAWRLEAHTPALLGRALGPVTATGPPQPR